ncbi:MAG: hypothetical protein V1799_14310 [bacterium]
MTALDSAVLDHRTFEGTSTLFPPFIFVDLTFHTRASTTLLKEYELSDKAIETISKLKSFLKLEENWNSYGGIPPHKGVVDCATSLVASLDRKGFEVFFTAPGPDGEILVELMNGNRTVEITFDNEGRSTSAMFEGNKCLEESNSVDERKILQWLR